MYHGTLVMYHGTFSYVFAILIVNQVLLQRSTLFVLEHNNGAHMDL